jgi:hypothetical protein
MNQSDTTSRNCRVCRQTKPLNPSAKPKTRAYGWMGNQCWDCFVEETDTRQAIKRRYSVGADLAKVLGSWR